MSNRVTALFITKEDYMPEIEDEVGDDLFDKATDIKHCYEDCISYFWQNVDAVKFRLDKLLNYVKTMDLDDYYYIIVSMDDLSVEEDGELTIIYKEDDEVNINSLDGSILEMNFNVDGTTYNVW